MKLILILLIGIAFVGCNECQSELNKMDMGDEFDNANGEFHIYRQSNSYDSLVKISEIDFVEYKSDYGEFDLFYYMSRDEFDSLVYNYDSTGLELEYFRLTSCYKFVPTLIIDSNIVTIKCLRTQDGEYLCEDDVVKLVVMAEPCKNVIRCYIKVDYDKLEGKEIHFQPFSDKEFKLIQSDAK